MEKLKAGTEFNLDLKLTIHLNQDTYFDKKTISEYIESMVKYYFTGDISILEKYIRGNVDIKETIEWKN